MTIGPSLEAVRKDLRLVPTPTLVQYKQNPSKQAFDGVPMDMLAGLELSRRAQLQQEQLAKTAPNPQQMPTVVDQAAQQLSGMPPQGMPQPQGAPQQAPQFASAPPQQAPQQPPQQQAQAPQQPMQPTQQQPQKLSAGGIATLGDMQDASMLPQAQMAPQGNPLMTNQGSPIMRMAGGGIVAFVNNEDQPVDANMPSTEDLNRPATVNPNIQRQGQRIRDRARSAMEEERARNMAEVNNASTPLPDTYRRGDPRAKPMTREEAGLPPETESDIQITKTEDPFAKIYDLIAAGSKGGGGGGGMSPEVKNAIKEGNEILAATKNLKSPEIAEEDRQKMIDEQFRKNQEASKPVFDMQTKMLQEARDANARRREDAASNARLRFGLGLLGSKSPTLGGAISESSTPALDAYDRAAELADVADEKNRAAEMDLARSRLADEKNDRKAAQDYFDSYQRNKREAYAAQVQALQLRASASKMPADLSLHQQQINAQGENAGLRSQIQMLGLIRNLEADKAKNARAGLPTIADTVRLKTYLDQKYAPTGAGTLAALSANPEVMALLKNKTITMDNPKVQAIIQRARDAEARSIQMNSRTSGGGTSASELEGALGIL